MNEILKRPNGKYWTEIDIQALDEAKNYKELLTIALRVLEKIPQPIVQICGPISTGGKGSVKENTKEFNKAIFFFTAKGEHVFDQIPFQSAMQRLKKEVDGYDERILTDFYLPIFQSGYIKKLKFLPDWESSKGTKWENEQGKKLKIFRVHLPQNWDVIV